MLLGYLVSISALISQPLSVWLLLSILKNAKLLTYRDSVMRFSTSVFSSLDYT
jgi:hypothetical protein